MWTIGKFIWFATCACLGVLATGVEVDRAARKDERAVGWTPEIFKGYALETHARDALANGANEEGLASARELVRRRPVPAESLALYTNALLAAGKGDAAAPALMLAAQRGWRDRYVQRLMVLVGTQSGDWQSAAQRLIALWRQSDDGEETHALSKQVLSNPEGLRTFLDQLGPYDRWYSRFLAWAAAELPVSSIRNAAVAGVKRQAPIDCRRLSFSTYDLAVSGGAEAAAAVWDAACSRNYVSMGAGLAFTDIPEGMQGPLDWRYPDNPDVTIELTGEGHGMSLEYTNAAPVRVVVAERFALLPAGAHRIRLEAAGQMGDARALILRVSCFSKSDQPFRLGNYEVNGAGAEVTVPTNCPSQRLDIDVAHGSGAIRTPRFD